MSKELGFPLRVKALLDDRTVKLRNIKRGPQDAALFAMPEGYKLVAEVPGPPPAWAGQIAGAPLLTPPFEKTLAEGEIFRIRPQTGRSVSMQATNASDASCAMTAVGFKGGRPLQDPMMNTVNLEARDSVKVVLTEGPAEADDLVVRVGRGSVTFKAESVPAPKG